MGREGLESGLDEGINAELGFSVFGAGKFVEGGGGEEEDGAGDVEDVVPEGADGVFAELAGEGEAGEGGGGEDGLDGGAGGGGGLVGGVVCTLRAEISYRSS